MFQAAGPVDRDRLQAAFRELAAAQRVYRLKGFARVKDSPMRLVVQAVGPRLTSYFDREWQAGETPSTQLVVIGDRSLSEEQVVRLLEPALLTNVA